MKKNFLTIGLIVIILMFGISIIGCDDGSDGSITIDGWKFNVYNDSPNGGKSTISMSSAGNILNVTGNLTADCGDDSA